MDCNSNQLTMHTTPETGQSSQANWDEELCRPKCLLWKSHFTYSFTHSSIYPNHPSIHPSSPFGQSVSQSKRQSLSQSSSISFSSSSSSSVSCVTDHISVFPFRQQASQASPIVLHSHHGDDGDGHQTTGTAVKISSEAPFVALMYMELLWLFLVPLGMVLVFRGQSPPWCHPKIYIFAVWHVFCIYLVFLDRTVDGRSVSLSWMVFSDLEIQVKFSC